MTETMQQILTSFDALPDADKHQVAIEILRRMPLSRFVRRGPSPRKVIFRRMP